MTYGCIYLLLPESLSCAAQCDANAVTCGTSVICFALMKLEGAVSTKQDFSRRQLVHRVFWHFCVLCLFFISHSCVGEYSPSDTKLLVKIKRFGTFPWQESATTHSKETTVADFLAVVHHESKLKCLFAIPNLGAWCPTIGFSSKHFEFHAVPICPLFFNTCLLPLMLSCQLKYIFSFL